MLFGHLSLALRQERPRAGPTPQSSISCAPCPVPKTAINPRLYLASLTALVPATTKLVYSCETDLHM